MPTAQNNSSTEHSRSVPKLRFSEFAEEWKENSFKNVVNINQGLQIQISERLTENEENTLFYITNEFLRKNSEKKYFIKNAPKSVICNKDDILMTRTGNTGKVVTNVVGAFHNNFFKIAYSKNTDKDFLVNFLNLEQTQNIILRLAGTSTIPDLNHSDFYKIIFTYPSLPEQQKIASFLTAVDKKIEQLTQKKHLLENYKKGAMQQIFSQQIRFKNEQGNPYPDWEEKKLGEVASFSKGKGVSKNDISENGITECIRYGELYTHYKETISEIISRTNVNANDLVLSKANDVIIPASGETQIDIATASCVLQKGIALGGDLNIIRSNMNGVFLSYMLNSIKKHDIARLSQGISVVHLYSGQLSQLNIETPSIQEQTKISNFLSTIDDKIGLVKTQLENTQQFKKGLLQQMFV